MADTSGRVAQGSARSTALTQLALATAHAGSAAASLLAGVGALSDVDHALVAIALLASVAVVGLDAWRVSRLEPGLYTPPLLGHGLALRVLTAAAIGCCFVGWAGGTAAASVAVALSIGVVLLEPALAQAREYRVTFVSHVPGLTPAPPQRDLEGVATTAHLGALVVGIALAAAEVSAWWWAVVVVVAAVPDLLMGLNCITRMRAARRIEASIASAIESYAPEFVVYTAWPEDGTHQVTMWLPYLERTGRRFVIVTRHSYPAELLAEHTDAPIVMRHGSRDLDDVVPPSLTTAFYVNASSGNSIFVRYHHLNHVFLGHGDSDKPSSYNPTHAMYDRVFAAGEAAVRRYAAHGVHIPRDKFDVVGRPQLEDVTQSDGPVATSEPVVLYAPTWRGHVEETAFHSLPLGEQIVGALLERGATVIFRPHPFSYTFREDTATIRRIQGLLEADTARTGRPHRWGAAAENELSVFGCVNASDAMVSDVSAVVSDFLFAGKPFAMVAMSGPAEEFVEDYPVAAASYVIERDLSNLDRALDDLLGPDPLAPTRLAIRKDYLGDFAADGYADAFVDRAREIIDAPRKAPDEEETVEGDGDDGGQRLSLSAVRNQLAIAARDIVTTGLAWIALVVGLASGPRGIGVALAVVATAMMAVLHRRARPGNLAFHKIAGSFQPARLLFLLALGVGWLDWHGWSWPVGMALALLAAAAAAEDTVRDCWDRVGLEARNLPALRVELPEPIQRGYLGTAGLLLVPVAWILGTVADSRIVLLALAIVLVVAQSIALAIGVVRVHRCVDAEEHLHGAITEYAPEFVVYFGSNIGAAYQLGMWMPYFERIGRPFIVVMRNLTMFQTIDGITKSPIIHRPSIRSLEDVVVPSARLAFYVNNATNNTHFIERRQMTHVWLNHGDSEKPACYNPVHAIYDKIFAAGQAGIDRYARHGVEIPQRKFQIVGRPQVEDVERAAAPIADLDGKTVLYAPTWRGPYADTQVYSLPEGPQIVQALLDRGATVIFRSHVFNYRFPESTRVIARIGAMLEADRARTKRQHRFGAQAEERMSLVDCFNASDAMVTDVSAVVSDYLQSGKPLAIVAVGRTPDQLRVEAPAALAAYVIRGDLSNLEESLDLLLGPDPLAPERDRTRVYYLGEFREGSYADGFLEAGRALIDARVDA